MTTYRGKPRRIVLISVSDGAIRVVKNVGATAPEWLELSPDGRWIAYDALQGGETGNHDIFLLSADGSREIPLVKHPADDCLLGWAPGGDWIVFSSDRTGSGDAYIVPVEDGKARGEALLVKRDFGRVSSPTGIVPMGFAQDGTFYYAVRSSLEDVYVAVEASGCKEALNFDHHFRLAGFGRPEF